MQFTSEFNCQAVKFSPFEGNLLAVACAQNFGIIGNGRQHILKVEDGQIKEVARYETQDGLYDCAWCEDNENIIASASGDGSIKIWDMRGGMEANPVRSLEEHQHEVQGLHWNCLDRSLFLSAAWDDTIKLWSLDQQHSLQTFQGHTYCVYSAIWNPHRPDTFLSASGDCSAKIWDMRQPLCSVSWEPHLFEVLTADWCKYNEVLVATGSVDKTVKIWDLRMLANPMCQLDGHQYAVRRLWWSPHEEHQLLSCSYDMTVRLWDLSLAINPCVAMWAHHSEFVIGVDWSQLVQGLVASAGWDQKAVVWGCKDATKQAVP
eukprot:TRINITY_DN2292_c0_g1_i1.p1 TRINITY_DN2292_c0_g1~~TRINITY_DN2292_c0_g1_i1.p1  ORF type:complete len:318 (-),score=34.69 TRINITY_DN2292_c0_g1_i1:298-1251(-)